MTSDRTQGQSIKWLGPNSQTYFFLIGYGDLLLDPVSLLFEKIKLDTHFKTKVILDKDIKKS